MSKETTPIKMRVNVAGYTGDVVSLIAAFDPGTDMLLVMKSIPYEAGPREGFLRVTTQARDLTHDAVFEEEKTREAITAYFELDAMKLIRLTDNTKRLDPRNRIERDGMDEGGMKFKIHPEISNGQVAVLLAAYYANQQRLVAISADFMSDVLYPI